MTGRWSWAGLLLCTVAGAALVLALSDPFGWQRRRLEQAQQAAAAGRHEAYLRQLERQAQQKLAYHQAELQQQQKTIMVLTDRAVMEAREQPDAETSLGDDRVRRLREHDRSLCGQNPKLVGCGR